MAEEWLKVRVDVDFLVLWITVEVKASTVCNIGVFKLKLYLIFSTVS